MKRSLILLSILLILFISCSNNTKTPEEIKVTNIPTTETPIIEVSKESELGTKVINDETNFSEVITEVKNFTTPSVIIIICIAVLVFTTMYYFLLIRNKDDDSGV